MTNESEQKRHSIRLATRRSGLTPDVLRAWEKRYGVVEPGRSPGGHRLYSDADIDRLRLVKAAVNAGARIGNVASLPLESLADLVAADRPPAAGSSEADAETFVTEALAAAESVDSTRLRIVLARAVATLSPERFLDEVAVRFLHRVGHRWADGKLTPGHEHLASQVLRQTAVDMLDALQPDGEAPRVVSAAPAGQRHHLGALLAAVSAAVEGWHATYLGGDLPAVHLGEMVNSVRADAVALSITSPADDSDTELRELRRVVGRAIPIVVGGQDARSLNETLREIGADHVDDLAALRQWFQSVRNRPSRS
jgi:DNA-binding transcriptional MerR regulator/methylmalonyl-CoA mutase cobalamin-binding subunit